MLAWRGAAVPRGLAAPIALAAMASVMMAYTGIFYLVTGLPVRLTGRPENATEPRNRILFLLGFLLPGVIAMFWFLKTYLFVDE